MARANSILTEVLNSYVEVSAKICSFQKDMEEQVPRNCEKSLIIILKKVLIG